MRRFGDSLYVFDLALRRLSIVTLSGDFVRSLSIGDSTGGPGQVVVGVLPDRSLVARRLLPPSANSPQGRNAPLLEVARFSMSGVALGSIARFKGDEVFTAPYGRAGASVTRAIFARQSGVAIIDSTVLLLSSDSDSILRLTASGIELGRLSVPDMRRDRVRPSDMARARELFVPSRPSEFPYAALFDAQPPPTEFPVVGWGGKREIEPLRGSFDGTAWLLRYGGVRASSSTWFRYSARGVLLDSLTMPQESLILDAIGGTVLVGTVDDDGADVVLVIRRDLHGVDPESTAFFLKSGSAPGRVGTTQILQWRSVPLRLRATP
jgi:hypothetical protein